MVVKFLVWSSGAFCIRAEFSVLSRFDLRLHKLSATDVSTTRDMSVTLVNQDSMLYTGYVLQETCSLRMSYGDWHNTCMHCCFCFMYRGVLKFHVEFSAFNAVRLLIHECSFRGIWASYDGYVCALDETYCACHPRKQVGLPPPATLFHRLSTHYSMNLRADILGAHASSCPRFRGLVQTASEGAAGLHYRLLVRDTMLERCATQEWLFWRPETRAYALAVGSTRIQLCNTFGGGLLSWQGRNGAAQHLWIDLHRVHASALRSSSG